MSETDFDINNYTVADLLQILNIQNEVPITKEKIVETTQNFIDADNFKDNEDFVKFFLEIRRKLINEVERQREDYEKYGEEVTVFKNYGSLTDPLGDLKSADVKNLEQKSRQLIKCRHQKTLFLIHHKMYLKTELIVIQQKNAL